MNIQRVLALDIGADSIKTFFADIQPGALRLHHHGKVDSIRLNKGELFNPSALAVRLQQAVDCVMPKDGMNADWVIVGLSGVELGSEAARGSLSITSGKITEKDLIHVQKAAELATLPETAELLHIENMRYRVDGHAIQGRPIGQVAQLLECECVVMAASHNKMENIRQALAAAHIAPNSLVANIFAIYQTVTVVETSYVILDIGAETTDFVLCDNGKLVQAGALPVGGNIITEAISQAAGLDFDHAEQLKRYFSRLDSSIYGQKVLLDCSEEKNAEKNIAFDFLYDIIHNRTNAISELLGGFLQQELAERGISVVYLTGGCLAMEGFLGNLSESLKIQVKALDLQRIPEPYRVAENAAAYALLQYAQIVLATQQPACRPRQQVGKKPESFVGKIRNILHL